MNKFTNFWLLKSTLDFIAKFFLFTILLTFFAKISPTFILHDDYESYWAPFLFWFGDKITLGLVPTIMGPGGIGLNYISEAQFGLYNPFVVSFALISNFFDDILFFSILFKAFILVMLQVGSSRVFKFSGANKFQSELFGFGLATSGYIMYMEVSSWTQSLFSMALTLVSLSFLIKPKKNKNDFLLAVFFLYLSFTIGYVYTAFVNSIIVCLLFNWYRKSEFIKSFTVISSGVLSGLAIFAIYAPGLFSSSYTWRSSIYPNNSNFFTPNLGDLIGSTMLSMQQDLTTWGGPVTPNPTGYIFMGIAAVASFFSAKKLLSAAFTGRLAISSLILFLLISLGPSDFGPFHWPGRYTPWLAFSSLWVLSIAQKNSNLTKRNYNVAVIIIIIGFGRAVSLNPRNYLAHIISLTILIAFTMLYFELVKGRNVVKPLILITLFLGTITQHLYMNFTEVKGFAAYNSPSLKSSFNLEGIDLSLNTFQLADFGRVYEKGSNSGSRFFFGKQSDMVGLKQLNTGTAIGHRNLSYRYCATFNGSTCPEILNQITEKKYEGNNNLLDLMDANQIIAEPEYHFQLKELMPSVGWYMSSKDSWREVWRRIEFEPQDMVVNSRLANFQILKDRNFDNGVRKVTIVTGNEFTGDNIILSQLNYPKLFIDSQRSVRVIPSTDQASNSFFVLAIPAGKNSVEIEWEPPLWRFSYTINTINYVFWISLLANFSYKRIKWNNSIKA
jgi:hypothetical protein